MILAASLFLCLTQVSAQSSSDCKFETFKDKATGKVTEYVTAPAKIGKFMMGRDGDRRVCVYTFRALFAVFAKSNNTVRLTLDSAQFIFDGGQKISVPVKGTGAAKNQSALKPELEDITFEFDFPKDQMQVFQQKRILGVIIHGEKDSRFGESLNEKQGEKFMKAVNCIQ